MLIIFCQYLFEGIFVLVCVSFKKRFYSYLFAQKVLKGTFGFHKYLEVHYQQKNNKAYYIIISVDPLKEYLL